MWNSGTIYCFKCRRGLFKFNNFPKYYHNTAWMNENFLCMSEEQIWCVWTIAISKLKVVKQVIMNGAFLAHLNWRLKWAFLMKICPLSVVVIVVVFVFVVVNFSHFDLLFQNQWASFNQTWHKSSLCEGPRPFPSGDNYRIVKIHWQIKKIFFSITTGPISTKHGINYPWA